MPSKKMDVKLKMDNNAIAQQIMEGYMETIEDVEILWCESPAKHPYPCAEFGYFMTPKRDGKHVVIRSPRGEDAVKSWLKKHPGHLLKIKRVRVDLVLTELEASVVKGDPDYADLDEVLVNCKNPLYAVNKRTRNVEEFRINGLRDVIKMKDEPTKPKSGK